MAGINPETCKDCGFFRKRNKHVWLCLSPDDAHCPLGFVGTERVKNDEDVRKYLTHTKRILRLD